MHACEETSQARNEPSESTSGNSACVHRGSKVVSVPTSATGRSHNSHGTVYSIQEGFA